MKNTNRKNSFDLILAFACIFGFVIIYYSMAYVIKQAINDNLSNDNSQTVESNDSNTINNQVK